MTELFPELATPETYRVLARKYRPTTLDTLVGQEVLVRTLRNAIDTGRLAHAFLLTGIRGVGKTTTARIIARGLNCTGPDGNGGPTTSPCGECANCQMIAEERHVDILEMDAASHTGVDDIRSLIDTVHYRPSIARYKVYIIDEVHMLSNSAFNALLKTLEEPPPHVKFVFATTEIRKIPVTILSRCQRFDLRRVDAELLSTHLENILKQENLSAEPQALHLIAEAAEGSVRDSLSLLDQAIAHGHEGGITAETVRGMLGLSGKTPLFDLLEALCAGDVAKVLTQFKTLHNGGADPLLLMQDLLELSHFLTRLKLAPNIQSGMSYSENEVERGRKLSASLSVPVLSRLWQMLLKGIGDVRHAPNATAAAEMVLIRIAYASELPTPAELIRASDNGKPVTINTRPPQSPVTNHQSPISQGNLAVKQQPAPMEDQNTVMALATYEDAVALFDQKREAILYSYLCHEVRLVAFEQGRIELNPSQSVPPDFAGKVGKALSDWTGQRWMVIVSRGEGQPTLGEKAEAARQKQMQDALATPMAQQIFAAFPGSELKKLHSKEVSE